MNIELRKKIEKAIASKVITAALKHGYKIMVYNGEDEYPFSTDKKNILANMFQTDEEKLYLKREKGKISWVYFVYGNDGWDVVCDYTVDLDKTIMPEVNKLSDFYCEHFC